MKSIAIGGWKSMAIHENKPYGFPPATKTRIKAQESGFSQRRFVISKQALLQMKLTIVFLLAVAMQVSAGGFAQTLTLSVKEASLSKVFKEITRQTGYTFIYASDIVKTSKPVSLEVREASLKSVLDDCFKNQHITYAIVDKMIVVKEKAERIQASSFDSNVVNINVTGKVINEKGEPVEGVTVIIKGGRRSTMTDANGVFELKGIDNDASLILTSVNIESITISVNGKSNLDIQVQSKAGKLDEIKVIGYGTTTQRYATGSVSKITSREINSQPVSNVLQSLQGRATGVVVSNSNGLPGAEIKIQVRGQNSITAGNDPLYIIDGVPFISQAMNDNINLKPASGNISPFSTINPNDIASIEILKDADATVIYGSRGANGVVLITTKKGQSGRVTLEAQVYAGAGEVSKEVDMLNTSEYLALRREAFKNDNIVPTSVNAPDLLLWDTTKSINWQKYLAGRSAKVTDAQVSISGGNSTTRFIFGANYRKEGTPFLGDFTYTRAGAYINTDFNTLNNRFTGNIRINYGTDRNNSPAQFSKTLGYFKFAPNYPLYNDDGQLYWYGATTDNPLAFLLQKSYNNTNTLIANSQFRYLIIPGLSVKSSFGYTKTDLDQVFTFPKNSINPFATQSSTAAYPGSARFANNTFTSYLIEPQIDFNRSFNRGRLELLFGGSWQYSIRESFYVQGIGYTNEALLESLAAASTINSFSNSFTEYKYASIFSRVKYSYENKYILNASFRRDGSSRFGPDKQFGNFGAVGLAWLLSNESFLKDKFKWLSYGKLRSSYGITGNDQIADYQFLETYYSSPYTYNGQSALVPSRIANPDYSWETNRKLEIALELGFLKDRFLFQIAHYRNRSSNQLTTYPIPSQTGFVGYQVNLPALVQNSGWELEFQTTNIQSKDFSWTSALNITLPKNRLIKFPGIEATSYSTIYVVGEPLSVVRGYQFTGIDPKTGAAQYLDKNKDQLITSADDYSVIGNLDPVYYGGLSNSFQFKGFDLSIFLQFAKKDAYNLYRRLTDAPGVGFQNYSQNILDRWQYTGDLSVHSGATTISSSDIYKGYYNRYSNSSAALSDASYLSIKNVNIAYNLTPKWLKRAGILSCRIYLQGQNLWTFTKYYGNSAEDGLTNGIPVLRTLTAGINIKL